ncbi:transposase [Mycolicibacterium sp. TY81]|uniref:transposase n=1 Tax=Mycolicibacterium sp. TY81 TaxID=2759662 RepID=UPI001BB5EC4D|nr:transposase [Mycolicibacterium sp. TY81]BCJ79447.1 hypothetical protein MTY81_08200 [Mycolicibacterium sp. TY81]
MARGAATTPPGLIAAAKETLALWGSDGMNFAELAEDIAHEAEQALFLTRQIKQIDERVANLYADADPDGIVASAPGVGPVISAVIAGRIGDPHRFTSLAAVRAYTGLVPKVSQSGVGKVESSITKAGDPLLREMLCTAADQARKVDPQIAAKYQRLMAATATMIRRSAIWPLCWSLGSPRACAPASPTPYAMSTAPPSPKLRAACSSKSATRLSRAAETTSGTTVCATAANRGRARSHRSRRTLQHPGPPPITLRANTSLDIR